MPMLDAELTGRTVWGIDARTMRSLVHRHVILGLDPTTLGPPRKAGEGDDEVDPVDPKGNGTVTVSRRNGVSIIPVHGPIFHRDHWVLKYIGATSGEAIRAAFLAESTDPAVNAVVLDVDSPGGHVKGTSELASVIRRTAKDKPVMAFSGGDYCSCGYYLACATSEIVVADSSEGGCIGVLSVYYDDRKFLEKLGIDEIVIVSDQSPDKVPDPATKKGYAQIKAQINDQADIFIRDVARYRGVSRRTVLKEFGRGNWMIGAKAVDCGLADRIGTLDGVVAELAAGYRPERKGSYGPGRPKKEVAKMSFKSEFERLMGKYAGKAKAKARVEDDEDPDDIEDDDDEDEDEDDEATARRVAPGRQSHARVRVSASRLVDPEAERLRKENADLKAAQKTRDEEEVKSAAKRFADDEIRAERSTPARRPQLEASYMAAAHDDREHPRQVAYVEGGEPTMGTRLQALRSAEADRQPHGMTREWVPGREADKDAHGNRATPAEEERRNQEQEWEKEARADMDRKGTRRK